MSGEGLILSEGLGPEQNSRKQVPLNAKPIIPESSTYRYRNMRESIMGSVAPAKCTFSALADRQNGDASMANKTGTERPPYILPGFDDNHEFLYLIPVTTPIPGAVPVSYSSGRASFSLYAAFQHASRLTPEGRREIYPLLPSPGEITIGDTTGWGLVCALANVTSEPITTLSDEEKARRKATRERNKQKRNAGGGNAATGD